MEAGHTDTGYRLPKVSQNPHFTFEICFIHDHAQILLRGKNEESDVDEMGREIRQEKQCNSGGVCVCVGVGWGAWVVLIWKQIECLNLVPVMRSGRKVEKNGLKVAGKVFEAA